MTQSTSKAQKPISTTKTTNQQPKNILLDKWEDIGFHWSGNVNPSELTRLFQLVESSVEHQPISLSCELKRQGGVLWLNWQVQGSIWIACQRCLQPMEHTLTNEYQLALLQDDSQASLLNDEQDYILLDEVILPNSVDRKLPLLEIIEDGLLLDIPLSPKHEHCEMYVQQSGEITEQPTDNPFAILAGLKKS